MSFDIMDQINSFGGAWKKLNRKEHGVLEGTVISAEVRDKTFEGTPVVSRKSGKVRQEWVITLQTDENNDPDDDGVRKFSANESAQRAIATAVKDSKKPLEEGSYLKIAVVKDPASSTEQAEYKAQHTGASKVSVPADPWADADEDDAPPF